MDPIDREYVCFICIYPIEKKKETRFSKVCQEHFFHKECLLDNVLHALPDKLGAFRAKLRCPVCKTEEQYEHPGYTLFNKVKNELDGEISASSIARRILSGGDDSAEKKMFLTELDSYNQENLVNFTFDDLQEGIPRPSSLKSVARKAFADFGSGEVTTLVVAPEYSYTCTYSKSENYPKSLEEFVEVLENKLPVKLLSFIPSYDGIMEKNEPLFFSVKVQFIRCLLAEGYLKYQSHVGDFSIKELHSTF